jgi:prolyl-tRNA synthetase
MDNHVSVVDEWDDFIKALDKKHIIHAPFCGRERCEDKVKELSKNNVEDESGAPSMGAKSLCIPVKQAKTISKDKKCIEPKCNYTAKNYTLFGRSY